MKHQDIETLPQVSEVKMFLIQAKALIDKPHKWCRGHDSRPSCYGIQYCSVGALQQTEKHFDNFDVFAKAWETLQEAISYGENVPIQTFNDTHPHEDVMALWDKAIAIS